jgi:hypothetical protein
VSDEGLVIRYPGGRGEPWPIAFEDIRWVKPNPGWFARLWVVHGHLLRTLQVPRTWVDPADYDQLISLLQAQVPPAFTPDPPPGWRPPYD